MLAAPPPSPVLVLRLGQAALAGGLLALLALTLALAVVAPALMWLVPVGFAAACVAVWLLCRPVAATYAAVGLSVMALDKAAGLQPEQVLYGLFAYAFLGVWYARRLMHGEPFVLSRLDRAVAVLLFVGFPVAAAIGLLFGASLSTARGEIITFSMLAFYFPVKEVCRSARRGPEVMAGLVVFVGAFVAARSFLNFRALMLRATEAWQIADVRLTGGTVLNEMHLLFAAVFTLVALVHVRSRRAALGLAVLVALTIAALVMTKSRGYWVDLALALAALLVLLRGRERFRLAALVFGGGALLLGMLYVFFGPLLTLILDGTLLRLASIGSAAGSDVSLLNRFYEAQSVMEKARFSPILGWGLGSEFTHFDIIERTTAKWEFIHNGYVALWFKLGVWGTALMLGIWAAAGWQGWRVYRAAHLPLAHRVVGLAAAVSLLALIPSVSTSSPFFTREMLQAMTFQFAIGAGVFQRYLSQTRAGEVRPRLGGEGGGGAAPA